MALEIKEYVGHVPKKVNETKEENDKKKKKADKKNGKNKKG